MRKKLWKQIIAIIMACALITGTAGSNKAFAAASKKKYNCCQPARLNKYKKKHFMNVIPLYAYLFQIALKQ